MKTDYYKMVYVRPMIIRKKKPIVDNTKEKEKGIKAYHHSKMIKSLRKTAEEEERNQGTKQPENKTAIVSPCLPLTTLNIHEFDLQSKGRE